MHRAALCVAFTALALHGCTADCATEACDDFEKPHPTGSIQTGIVGVVAYATDVCENDCCECTYSQTTLLVFETDTPVTDGTDAQARFAQMDPKHTLALDTRYAQPLDPGRYAACGPNLDTCANLEIADGQVFTLNLKTLHGPMQMRVFDDSGTRQRDLVVGAGAPF